MATVFTEIHYKIYGDNVSSIMYIMTVYNINTNVPKSAFYLKSVLITT